MTTEKYGDIGIPSISYKKQVPGSDWPGWFVDDNFSNALKIELGNRWLIVHIQNGFDGWPGAGGFVSNWSIYMDNYGQVWKIYTEGPFDPHNKNKHIIILNTSNTQLTDKLINLAKKTMGSFLGQTEFRGEGIRPPLIPSKEILDSFANP